LGLVTAAALAIGPAAASAASPVLEFESPRSPLPVPFTAEGGEVTAALSDFDTVVHCVRSEGSGAVTGPRAARSKYELSDCETQGGADGGRECQSEGAKEGEIQTPMIDAELVFIDQASHLVGMLLDPQGGVYLEFECAGEGVKAFGPFLSPVGPVNQEATSFTASLDRSDATQSVTAYESLTGEKLQAIPTGERESQPKGTTGVELSFAIDTSSPLTIKAVTAAEVEAAQRQEEEAAKKRHDDEEAAKAAAEKKRREGERTAAKKRARQLSKALKQCRKGGSKQKRARCEQRAKKRFASHKVTAK
jgi:hypothetical protein